MTSPILTLSVVAILQSILIYILYSEIRGCQKDIRDIVKANIKLASLIDQLIKNDSKHQENIKSLDNYLKLTKLKKEQSQ